MRTNGDGVTEWVVATSAHPFYTGGAGWVDAGDLTIGDLLIGDDGTAIEITALDANTRVAVVHNLTVDRIHTYYAITGDQPALVHNCSFGANQQALIGLAKQNARSGVSRSDARILVSWAREYGVPHHAAAVHRSLPRTNKWYGVEHIKISRTHIRVI